MQVQSSGQKEPVEEKMTTYSLLGNPMDRGAWQATVHGVAKQLDMTQGLSTQLGKNLIFAYL